MGKEVILEKIRKLLRLAKCSGSTEAEAMVAMARARDLMEKHQIEKAEVAAAEGRAYLRIEDLGYEECDRPFRSVPSWRRFIHVGASKVFECESVELKSGAMITLAKYDKEALIRHGLLAEDVQCARKRQIRREKNPYLQVRFRAAWDQGWNEARKDLEVNG